jgi:hypothetical protein
MPHHTLQNNSEMGHQDTNDTENLDVLVRNLFLNITLIKLMASAARKRKSCDYLCIQMHFEDVLLGRVAKK